VKHYIIVTHFGGKSGVVKECGRFGGGAGSERKEGWG